MSQSQTAPVVETPVVETPDAAVRQPAPAHDGDPVGAVPGSSPAPAAELPTDLNTSGPTTPPAPPATEKGGDPKTTAPPTTQGVTPLHMLGDSPQWIDCPFCKKRTLTSVTKEGTGMQILAGALCCLLCVCLACVPCMAGWCEDTHYSCSGCRERVATRPYDGPMRVFGPEGPVHPVVPSQYEPTAPPAYK